MEDINSDAIAAFPDTITEGVTLAIRGRGIVLTIVDEPENIPPPPAGPILHERHGNKSIEAYVFHPVKGRRAMAIIARDQPPAQA